MDLYFKIILQSVTCGLVVWDGSANVEQLSYLELLHHRAARVIYNLPRDNNCLLLESTGIRNGTRLIKVYHSSFTDEAPASLSYLTNKPYIA